MDDSVGRMSAQGLAATKAYLSTSDKRLHSRAGAERSLTSPSRPRCASPTRSPPCSPTPSCTSWFGTAMPFSRGRGGSRPWPESHKAHEADERDFQLWLAGATVLRGWSIADGSGTGAPSGRCGRVLRLGGRPGPSTWSPPSRHYSPKRTLPRAAGGRAPPAAGRPLPGGADRGALV